MSNEIIISDYSLISKKFVFIQKDVEETSRIFTFDSSIMSKFISRTTCKKWNVKLKDFKVTTKGLMSKFNDFVCKTIDIGLFTYYVTRGGVPRNFESVTVTGCDAWKLEHLRVCLLRSVN